MAVGRQMVYPVPLHPDGRKPRISDSFGFSPKRGRLHAGSDIMYRKSPCTRTNLPTESKCYEMPNGTPALAMTSGKVIKAELQTKGHHIQIDHGTIGGANIQTQYFHLRNRLVKIGDTVRAGQPVGIIYHNISGYKLNHLHFQLRRNGTRIDPGPTIKRLPVIKAPGVGVGGFLAKAMVTALVAWGIYKLLD